MKIEKYKKLKSGQYSVSFSNNKEMKLYEEVILSFGLLLKPDITSSLLLEITSKNEEWDVYYQALKLIKTKSRTTKEIEDTLLKKEYPKNLIDIATVKLNEQKYLDDKWYAKAYVNRGIIQSKGPYAIIKELEKKGVEKEFITESLDEYSDEIECNILNKKIRTMIKRNHTKSNIMLKQKIISDLISQGFNKENIVSILSEQTLNDDSDIIKKEYEKIKLKLSKKYSGKELDYKVQQKLYQKGMTYNEHSN